MGQKILGIDWQEDFGEVFGDDLYDATLIRVTPGTVNPSDIAAGTNPQPTSYACKGYESSWTVKEMSAISLANGDRIKVTDRKIVILGSSIAPIVPRQGDRVTIGGKTYNVTPVEGDGSGASYTLAGRG